MENLKANIIESSRSSVMEVAGVVEENRVDQKKIVERILTEMEKNKKQLEELRKEIRQATSNSRPAVVAPPAQSAASAIVIPLKKSKPSEFEAKNELLANGIDCSFCQQNIKVKNNNMGDLLDEMRIHVLTHFNTIYPTFKRFNCIQCAIGTNFPKEIENHLRKHGSLMKITEKRDKLLEEKLNENYLQALATYSSKCFPEVFEDIPKSLESVDRKAPPMRALRGPFPYLLDSFRIKNHIPNERMGQIRRSEPAEIVQIND
ncbi:unnamed protein product [Caenorhabditis bovis]|uniref:Uncharacterized protein n=1 Tax=Caenorhabditis bovis TaxID=2654633 RepID=A0A8S1F588_9PELO|nr:unnamed protein product [Caenorhabditis bovis]